MAYKGLGGTVPPHSRTVITTPSACYAVRVFNAYYNHLSFFLFQDEIFVTFLHVVPKKCRKFSVVFASEQVT